MSASNSTGFLSFFTQIWCCYLIIPTCSKTVEVGTTAEHVSPVLELGEGPHWDPLTQSLYFVDLHRARVNRYHPETNGYFIATIDDYEGDVSLIIPAEGKNNNFVVGLGPSIGIIEWDGRSNKTSRPKHVKLVDETPGNRLNDGKADATGRLWVGSMGPEIKESPGHYHKRRGSLYSVELDGTVIKRLSNVSISNGMAWSLDKKKFYYVDTYKFAVEAYDFDIVSGNLSKYMIAKNGNLIVIFDEWLIIFSYYSNYSTDSLNTIKNYINKGND
uniref:Regucalcin n=1 Tax=Sipha flava TaxID=143950 RepID=A0A2S2QZ38_9HEMI